MANKDLELALRIKADLDQGKAELQAFSQELSNTGEAAESASADLARMGESSEQQRARIRAMVEASLAQASAHDQAAQGAVQMASALDRAGAASDKVAAAQTAAMNAYHQAERAASSTASSQDKVATSTRTAATAADQQAQELTDLLGRIDPVVRELDKLDAMERQLAQAHRAGRIDTDTWTAYNAKLAENRSRLAVASDMTGRAAMTTRQYQQAMRQLPMQITDVTTSLASGMPIWMVAIQQGGQIKDSFGGIGPAARAVVSAINPMTLALGAAAAAAFGLVVAHEQGAAEARQYREALILTGNAAGTSAGQMSAMAERIDGVVGTQRQAAAALAAAASTGKIAGADLEQVAQTAVQMQVAMGKAVEETIAEYVELAKDPVNALTKLDDKYHFLTASVLEQVSSLREQGREADAARLAMDTYSETMQTRTQQIAGDLGLVESAWQGIKNVAAGAWDAMLNVGREPTLEDDLKDIERRRLEAQYGPRLDRAGYTIDPEIQLRLDAERDMVLAKIRQRDLAAEEDAQRDQTRQDAADAVDYLNKLREAGLTREEQKAKAIAEYWREIEALRAGNPDSELLSETNIQQGLAAVEKRFQAPDRGNGRTDAERLADQNRRWVEQLEKEAATFGLGKAATREYELEQRNLTGALLERAQAVTKLFAAEEERLAIEADARAVAGLQIQLLRSQGKESAAAALELEQRYGELMTRLQERADTAGVEIVKSLINTEQARKELSGLQKELDRIFNDTSRREQTIQAQVNAGLITEGEARRRIVKEHQKQAQELENILLLTEAMAEQTGNPVFLEEAERIRAELELLKYTADEVAIAFRDGLQGGLEESIMGLVDGTMSLRDALESLVLGIVNSMARMASEQLADMATQNVLDLFQQGAQAATAAAGQKAAAEVAAIQTVTLAQQAADTTRASSSVLAANTAAAGQAGAAASTATAWQPAAIAASIGSFGSAAAIGLAAVVAAMAFQAFADGGEVWGAGTGTSDSIPAWLSNGEFVTRAAIMAQPGARAFQNDFNTRGMTAIQDWSGAVHHATGGLAGVPAPAMPVPSLSAGVMPEPASALAPTVANNFRFAALLDTDDLVARLGSSPGFTDVLIRLTADNSTAMQSALNN